MAAPRAWALTGQAFFSQQQWSSMDIEVVEAARWLNEAVEPLDLETIARLPGTFPKAEPTGGVIR